jgi:hypothetical protein
MDRRVVMGPMGDAERIQALEQLGRRRRHGTGKLTRSAARCNATAFPLSAPRAPARLQTPIPFV